MKQYNRIFCFKSELNGQVCAKMDIQNIDTDMIIPKQFLKTIKRSGESIYTVLCTIIFFIQFI